MNIALRRRDIHYFLFVGALIFSDILNNGNLNLLYFWGTGVIICELLKKGYFWRDLALYLGPILLIHSIFFIFSEQEISVIKAFVYIAKLTINIALFSFFKENTHKISLPKAVYYIGICFSILLIAALLTIRFPWLWRLNDPFNNYSKTRLEFLYSEPSVLGLLSGYMLVFVSYSIFEYGFTWRSCGLLAVFGFTLLLTFSLSAMAYTAIAIMYLLLSKLFNRRARVALRIIVISMALCCCFFLILATNNPISNRLLAILNHSDSSVHYRWELSMGSIRDVLSITKGYGLGLGNMSTPQGLAILRQTGIPSVYANSFLYFIAENGWLGVAYITYLLLTLSVSIFKNGSNINDPSSLRVAFLLFVFIEQIAGGYFTDPLLWCLYGVVSARRLDKYCLRIE